MTTERGFPLFPISEKNGDGGFVLTSGELVRHIRMLEEQMGCPRTTFMRNSVENASSHNSYSLALLRSV